MGEEIIEADDGDDELGDDFIGFRPAELFAAVERELQRADADGQGGESEPVEAKVAILPGLVHEDQEAEHGVDYERRVDKEYHVSGIEMGVLTVHVQAVALSL